MAILHIEVKIDKRLYYRCNISVMLVVIIDNLLLVYVNENY